MRFRKLRIAWSVFWGLVAMLLIVLWVRSLNRIDGLTWHYHNADAFRIGTAPGQVSFSVFVDQPVPPATIRQVGRLWMTTWFESMQLLNGKMQWGFEAKSSTTFFTVSVPDWFLILSCGGIGSILWFRWRFTLRTLLIATTLVAMIFGAIVYAVK